MNKRLKYKENTPERSMCEFLYAWKSEDFKKMVSLSHPTWKRFYRKPIDSIEFLFGHLKLVGGVIQSVDVSTKNSASYIIKTKLFLIDSDGVKQTRTAEWNVWYETKKFEIDLKLNAEWGVNPLSGALSLNKNNQAMLNKIRKSVQWIIDENKSGEDKNG